VITLVSSEEFVGTVTAQRDCDPFTGKLAEQTGRKHRSISKRFAEVRYQCFQQLEIDRLNNFYMMFQIEVAVLKKSGKLFCTAPFIVLFVFEANAEGLAGESAELFCGYRSYDR
jgi:hypothetical protein